MRILRHEMINEKELLSRLKQVRLKGFGEPLIYESANLSIVPGVMTGALYPPQRYVLKGTVETILEIADAFEKRSIDIFALRGAVFFWLEGSDPLLDPPIPLLPPIVEISHEPGNRMVPLINDGMHRTYSARKRGREINIVLVANVPREYPYYAYALKDGWKEVQEIEELTDGFKKKEYRNPDNYKALFRNFNAVFQGVQEQRKQTQPELKE